MALLKSAHGGNIREAAALLGIAPGELLDFSANINPLGMPASLRQAIVDNPGCAERYRRWLPTISCRRRISLPATAKLNRSSPSSTALSRGGR